MRRIYRPSLSTAPFLGLYKRKKLGSPETAIALAKHLAMDLTLDVRSDSVEHVAAVESLANDMRRLRHPT